VNILLADLGHGSRAAELKLALLAEFGTTTSCLTALGSSGTCDSLMIERYGVVSKMKSKNLHINTSRTNLPEIDHLHLRILRYIFCATVVSQQEGSGVV